MRKENDNVTLNAEITLVYNLLQQKLTLLDSLLMTRMQRSHKYRAITPVTNKLHSKSIKDD